MSATRPDTTQEQARWVAQFDDPDEQNEVTFRPADVTVEKLSTEWITVEAGGIVNLGDWE